MTDPKKTEAVAAEDLTDESMEAVDGGYEYRLKNVLLSSYSVNTSTHVEDDEPIAMSKGFSIKPNAAFDIKKWASCASAPAGETRKGERPTETIGST